MISLASTLEINMTTLTAEFKKEALKFIDSFMLIHHSFEDFGRSSNFLHQFKVINDLVSKLDINTFGKLLNTLPHLESTDDHALTTRNVMNITHFMNDVRDFQTKFLALEEKPNFIKNLTELKESEKKFNWMNIRSIIYYNCSDY